MIEEKVKSISEHKTRDIFSKSYRSAVSIPAMTTLTGFIPHKDTYYVDGATIKFCMGVHTIYKIIFPDLEIWERELDIYKGDD